MGGPPRKADFSPRLEIQRFLDLVTFRIAENDALDKNCPELPPTKRARINTIFDLATRAADAWDSGQRVEACRLLDETFKVDRRWRATVTVRDETQMPSRPARSTESDD